MTWNSFEKGNPSKTFMLLCLYILKPGVFAYLILFTWSVYLLPLLKLDDDNCLLVKPT